MLLWQIGNYLVPLVTFPYLARVLGPAQFGVVGFATALAVYGTILTEWGFNLSGPRTTAQWRHDRDKLGELVWSIIGAKSCFCLLSAALLAAFLPFAPDMAGLRPLVWIGWIGVAANVITLNWLLLGMERFTLFAGIAVASRFATLPLTFWLVRSPNDVVCVVAIQAGAALIAAAGSLIVAHRNGWLCWPRFSWPAVRSQICDSADMFVSTASVSLFGATNAVILGGFAGPYQIGLYAAADKLKTVGNMVPAQINTVLYPRIAALLNPRETQGTRAAARLTALGLAATAATTGLGLIACVALSAPLIRIVLGAQFVDAAPVVNWLCAATLFGNLAYFIGLQVLVPFGGARRRAVAMVAAGGLNVLLALCLVPHFGAQGAAAACLVAEAALLGVFVSWIVRSPVLRAHFTQLTKT